MEVATTRTPDTHQDQGSPQDGCLNPRALRLLVPRPLLLNPKCHTVNTTMPRDLQTLLIAHRHLLRTADRRHGAHIPHLHTDQVARTEGILALESPRESDMLPIPPPGRLVPATHLLPALMVVRSRQVLGMCTDMDLGVGRLGSTRQVVLGFVQSGCPTLRRNIERFCVL
jgi:hypothetical protein